MDWEKQDCGQGKARVDYVMREYGLGKGRVWTGYSKSMDWVKGEYGLGKARVWTG